MKKYCSTCAGKEFVYCEQLGNIRRCMQCNAPEVMFNIEMYIDPFESSDEKQWLFAEALADCFLQVAATLDEYELKQRHS